MNLAPTSWGRLLLAQALVALGRRDEALTTLDPAPAHYRDMQVQGATHLDFRQDFARALHVHALAQLLNAAGTERRHDLPHQAARLLNELTDEARLLHASESMPDYPKTCGLLTRGEGSPAGAVPASKSIQPLTAKSVAPPNL